MCHNQKPTSEPHFMILIRSSLHLFLKHESVTVNVELSTFKTYLRDFEVRKIESQIIQWMYGFENQNTIKQDSRQDSS